MPEPLKDLRLRTRVEIIRLSEKNAQYQPLCWRCRQQVGTDVHEMLNRNLTVGNEAARRVSYLTPVCILLCRDCHQLAPTHEVEAELWHILYRVHGKGSEGRGYLIVYDLVNEFQKLCRSRITIDLPEAT